MLGQRDRSSIVLALFGALMLAGCVKPGADFRAEAQLPMLQLRPGVFTVNYVPASGACPASTADWKTVSI